MANPLSLKDTVNINTSGRAAKDGDGNTITTTYATKTENNNKVDKVTGKGLSTNDYTTTEKNKLAGIAAGAEVNVQSDWNQTNTSAKDYIKNKPVSAVLVAYTTGTTTTSVAASTFTVLPCSTITIVSSQHASASDKKVLLQPGKYMVVINGRVTDVSGSMQMCAGISVNGATTDPQELGAWIYGNGRHCWNCFLFLNLSTAQTVTPMLWTGAATTLDRSSMQIFRVGEA